MTFLIDAIERAQKPHVRLVDAAKYPISALVQVFTAWNEMGRADIAQEYTHRALRAKYEDLKIISKEYIN